MTEQMVVTLGADGEPSSVMPRMAAHIAPGVLHLAVSLQVVDPSGGWLLQQRAATKLTFASRWANTCCTHPAPGEEPAAAAVRRARQEVGLVVSRVVPAGCFVYRAEDPSSGIVEWELDHVFAVVADTSAATVDPAEIDDVARLPYADALRLVTSPAGAPWAAEVLERSFAALRAVGAVGPRS